MKNKALLRILSIAVAIILIVAGTIYIKHLPSPEKITTNAPETSRVEDEIPKNSDLNDISINMITNYMIPYRKVNLGGNALIDGSFANRTVFVFTVTGMKDLNNYFKSISIYDNERPITCDTIAKQYNKDEVLAICACDKSFDLNNLIVSIQVSDPKTGELMTFSKELGNEPIKTSKEVAGGDILEVTENGYWYRMENSKPVNQISKNGDNGPYYEYTRTLNFVSFGFYNNIATQELKFNSELSFDYDVSFSVSEMQGEEFVEYKNEDTTSPKQIIVTIKVYVNDMNDKINEQIISEIERSDILYKGNSMHITDGYVVETEYNS